MLHNGGNSVIAIASGQTLTLPGAVSFGVNGNYGPSLEGPGTLVTSGTTTLISQTGPDFQDLFIGDGASWTNSGTVTDGGLISFGFKSGDTASFVNQAGGVFDLTTGNSSITPVHTPVFADSCEMNISRISLAILIGRSISSRSTFIAHSRKIDGFLLASLT